MAVTEFSTETKVSALQEMGRIAGYAIHGLADPAKAAERMEELRQVVTYVDGPTIRAIFWKAGRNKKEKA